MDAQGIHIDTASAYVGTTSMFADTGFKRVVELDSTSANLPRWVMRLQFANH